MKNKIAHIIYQLLSFLFAYLFDAKTTGLKDGKENLTASFIIMPVVIGIEILVVSFSTYEKLLWRHTVFRRGISALMN
ncbi:MAG TPA: hypothetical protein VIJ95_01090 [Hanamia sp.]